MITPFEVYVVMQLDTISAVAGGMSFLLGFIFLMTLPFSIGGTIEDEEWASAARRLSWAFGLLFTAAVCAVTFLPSTKTAAAMIVLPALTSDEVVKPLGNEARELYDLAKQALKKAVDAPVTNESKVEKSDD